MEINSKIIDTLKDFKIYKDDGICYLISLYYEFEPTYIPSDIKKKVNASGIIDYDSKTGIQWNISLFKEQETNFNWVKTHYVKLFEEANPIKKGKWRDAVKRMKKLFSEYPEIRKEDVIEATKLYINENHPDYIRESQYFIEKGVGAAKTQDIIEWIDKYKDLLKNLESSIERKSKSNTIK